MTIQFLLINLYNDYEFIWSPRKIPSIILLGMPISLIKALTPVLNVSIYGLSRLIEFKIYLTLKFKFKTLRCIQ